MVHFVNRTLSQWVALVWLESLVVAVYIQIWVREARMPRIAITFATRKYR